MIPNFRIEENQREFYINCYAYFRGLQRDFDLKKGLLISGPVGTGKTTAMELFRKIASQSANKKYRLFNMINTRYVIREYMTEFKPQLVLDKYGRNSYFKSPAGVFDKERPIHFCFDDFGLENVNVKNFGNEQNIMEEVLLDRYDEWKRYGMLTLGTSNLQPKQIEEAYGNRVRDRIKEMMNYVVLDGHSKRK